MFFRWALYFTSQFDRFYNLNIAKKKLAKTNTVFNFIVSFTQVKTFFFFFETHKSKLQQTVENSIKINQYLTFFSDIELLLFRFLLDDGH